MSNLLAKLQQVVQGKPETPPKGFLTAKEWAKRWGKSSQHTRRLINAGLDNGILEEKPFRVFVGKLLRATPHYREVK